MFNERPGIAIFDLDGTLVDSLGDIQVAADAVRENNMLPPLGLDKVAPLIGHPAKFLFQDSLTDVNLLIGEFRKILSEVSGTHTVVMPGVAELLSKLQERGWTIAVASNKPSDLSRIVLERASLLNFITTITGTEHLPPKPDPGVVIAALGRKSWNSAVMIGDTTLDIHAGRAAGTHTLAVASGCQSRESLASAFPDMIVDSVSQIIPLLK